MTNEGKSWSDLNVLPVNIENTVDRECDVAKGNKILLFRFPLLVSLSYIQDSSRQSKMLAYFLYRKKCPENQRKEYGIEYGTI